MKASLESTGHDPARTKVDCGMKLSSMPPKDQEVSPDGIEVGAGMEGRGTDVM
jgi:hypothetical protein